MDNIIKQDVVNRNKTHLVGEVVRPYPKDSWGYARALHCAGVDVLNFEQFGSYQGDWWAQVRFPNGEVFYIPGSYGSCSGCDAFEGEFGWNDEEKPDYLHRLAEFGRDYLEDCYTFEQAVVRASKNLSWDSDAQEMVEWLTKVNSQIPTWVIKPQV